jgi:hypothetical protein
MDADALSTAAFVLGPERGLRLLEHWPDADALFVLKDQTVLSTGASRASPGRGQQRKHLLHFDSTPSASASASRL